MKSFYMLGVFGACFLLVSCKTAPVSPRDAFLSATKTQLVHYRGIYEVSIHGLRDRDEEVFRATKIATRGIRDAMLQCTNVCPNLEERIKAIEYAGWIIRSNRFEITKKLEMVCDPKTDVAVFYHLQTAAREELGLAVMSGRKLKVKIVVSQEDVTEPDKRP